jgi:hypothetical protein
MSGLRAPSIPARPSQVLKVCKNGGRELKMRSYLINHFIEPVTILASRLDRAPRQKQSQVAKVAIQ